MFTSRYLLVVKVMLRRVLTASKCMSVIRSSPVFFSMMTVVSVWAICWGKANTFTSVDSEPRAGNVKVCKVPFPSISTRSPLR